VNGKQLDKFSSPEDGHKVKYMQKSKWVTFLTHLVHVHTVFSNCCCFTYSRHLSMFNLLLISTFIPIIWHMWIH